MLYRTCSTLSVLLCCPTIALHNACTRNLQHGAEVIAVMICISTSASKVLMQKEVGWRLQNLCLELSMCKLSVSQDHPAAATATILAASVMTGKQELHNTMHYGTGRRRCQLCG